MLDNKQDIESVIDYIRGFIDEENVDKMLSSNEFARGGYAMCYKLIDGLERLIAKDDD